MKRLHTVLSLAAALLAATTARAQEAIELTGRDRQLEPAFEEVFRVGVLDGESWEMFATVPKVAFDERGNLYVFDRAPGTNNSDLRRDLRPLGRLRARVRIGGRRARGVQRAAQLCGLP